MEGCRASPQKALLQNKNGVSWETRRFILRILGGGDHAIKPLGFHTDRNKCGSGPVGGSDAGQVAPGRLIEVGFKLNKIGLSHLGVPADG